MSLPRRAKQVIPVGGDVVLLVLERTRRAGRGYPEGDAAIEVVGLRPGEKLREELLAGGNVEGMSHPQITRAYEHEAAWDGLETGLVELDVAGQAADFDGVLALLVKLVRDYAPA